MIKRPMRSGISVSDKGLDRAAASPSGGNALVTAASAGKVATCSEAGFLSVSALVSPHGISRVAVADRSSTLLVGNDRVAVLSVGRSRVAASAGAGTRNT